MIKLVTWVSVVKSSCYIILESLFSLKSDSRTLTMSFIVTTGTSFRATLWQGDHSHFTLVVSTMFQPRSVLLPYASVDLPAITSLGVST